MDAIELFDKWKKAKGLVTDMSAAERLGLGRAAVSRWRNGLSTPSAALVERMASEIGEDWRSIVLQTVAQQMEAADAASAGTLRRIAQTLVACLVLSLGGITRSEAVSNSAESNFTYARQAIHYAHWIGRFLRRLADGIARVKLQYSPA